MKTFQFFSLLLGSLGFFSTLLPAQNDTKLLKGEGLARQRFELNSRQGIRTLEGLSQSQTGLQVANSRNSSSEVLFDPMRIQLQQPQPFISIYAVLEGTGLDYSQVTLYYRTSINGNKWSDWTNASFDGHDAQSDERIVSKMAFIDQNRRYIQYKIQLDNTDQSYMALTNIEFFHYSPGKTPKQTTDFIRRAQQGTARSACAKPPVVSRSQWGAIFRSGAATSNVTHLIVHHEFGSNSSSNWAARVRSIQSFHINGNGWSDIGYNFLVDPNGVIYEGRAGGDNAIGAHFCGRNRNTMAVCMLGNFSTISPTAAAQTGLVNILSWKANKENISPLGSSFHSAVNGSLRHIAGHRDAGCSACPGNGMYNLLGNVRSRVNTNISNGCSGGGTPPPPPPSGDVTPPTTSISAVGGTTQSGSFTANFTDNDNVGVTRRYYQVLERYGNEWYANRNVGFFNDNYNIFASMYTVGAGTWATSGGHLTQTDVTSTNTQLSSYVAQNSGMPYLYEFSAKIVSTTGPQKFGLHIMSDDPSQSQRGNSYLIWFSGGDNKIRIYETVNNQLNTRAIGNVILDNNWANYKITYSPAFGVIEIFRNNTSILRWTDSSPIASGSTISLRTNATSMLFDDLKVYKFKTSGSRQISVGSSSSDDLRTSAGKIKSAVRDLAGNWSTVGNLDVNIVSARTATPNNGTLNFDLNQEPVLFPNPYAGASLRLIYHSKAETAAQVQIMDYQGKVVGEMIDNNTSVGERQLELGGLTKELAAGIYLVRVQLNEAQQSLLLMVQ